MKHKKVVITAKGGPEVLEVKEENIPLPTDQQVRIKVEYAGVAFAEVLMRRFTYPGMPKFPFTPGSDIVGIVDQMGGKVTGFSINDRVGAFLLQQLGGYSQYLCVDCDKIVKLPEGTDPVLATAATMNYITALQMFRDANLSEKKVVLVHGGGGGVGSALLELAYLHQVKAYSTASTAKQDVVRINHGVPIDYTRQDFVEEIQKYEPEGLHAVFDPVGGTYISRSYSLLSKGGTLFCYGFSGDYNRGFTRILAGILKLKFYQLLPDGKKVKLYQIRYDRQGNLLKDQQNIYKMVARGKLKPLIHGVMPLEEVKEAHRLLEGGKVLGKIILNCQG